MKMHSRSKLGGKTSMKTIKVMCKDMCPAFKNFCDEVISS